MNLAPAQSALGPILRAAPTLALLALLVLAGWLAARWFLYFTAPGDAPPPSARERVQLAPAAEALASAHLFGAAPTGAGGEVVSNLNIKLKGVFAGGPAGLAIVNAGDRDQAARAGSEIVPGVVLESVHPRHVLLRRAGALERVNLEERQQVAVAGAPTTASLSRRARARVAGAPELAPGAPPALAPSPAARQPRPEPHAPVGDVATEPPPAPPPAPMGAPAPPPAPPPALIATPPPSAAAQGLPITSVPPGSMLERLGLQPGDVIRTVNGEAVGSEADVARIVQQRGAQGGFTAEVQRGGMTIPIAVTPQR